MEKQPMAMYPFRESEGRLIPGHGVGHALACMAEGQSQTHVEAPRTIGGIVLYPTVKMTPAETAKRLGTGWHLWFSETIHIPIGNRIEFRFQGSTHLLALYNEGCRKRGETSIDGLPLSRLQSFGHKLTFVPAGHAFQEWHETSASTHLTFLYMAPVAFEMSGDEARSLLPRIYFEDSLVWETALRLKNAIESSEDKCLPYLTALSGVLGHELSRVDQKVVREPSLSRGGLASWQRRAVVDYIEEHLGEQVNLLKLAELSQLSLHHFCRAFKQSFGIPAHQFQVQRRMEIAKLLLADRTTPITEIALSLGYAHTSSFSNAFRKTTGWAPTVYRREFK
jgi:AraC family transcriptional regulator